LSCRLRETDSSNERQIKNRVDGCDVESDAGLRQSQPRLPALLRQDIAECFRGVPGHPFEFGFDLRLMPEKLGDPIRWGTARLTMNSRNGAKVRCLIWNARKNTIVEKCSADLVGCSIIQAILRPAND
jgi:hypothetical protein